MSVLSIQPILDDSILPTYSPESNYTLYSNADYHILPNERACIGAGFKMAFPANYCALIVKYNDISVLGGLIDSDFRGELGVIVTSAKERLVKRGDAVGTLLLLEIATPVIEDVSAHLEPESNESA